MNRSLAFILTPLAVLYACNTDIGITGSAVCDGVAQEGETTVDSPFDADGDGFFDGANPGCAATYPADRLDCHDGNADANPEGFELTCNGVDDDCDPETDDSEDEVCDDGVDNDCDTRIDEGCGTDTGGGNTTTWNIAPGPNYSCAYGLVGFNFSSVFVQDTGSQLVISPTGGGAQPGTMSGISATDFVVSNTLSGSCTEVYTLDATFTNADRMDGTFSVEFIDGGFGCFDCVDASWTIVGTRVP